MTIDPLSLDRCDSCGNAFEYDRAADGTCRRCGGFFDPLPERRGFPREDTLEARGWDYDTRGDEADL